LNFARAVAVYGSDYRENEQLFPFLDTEGSDNYHVSVKLSTVLHQANLSEALQVSGELPFSLPLNASSTTFIRFNVPTVIMPKQLVCSVIYLMVRAQMKDLLVLYGGSSRGPSGQCKLQ
jgi:hypothetical protein